jgi:hypothetical protein
MLASGRRVSAFTLEGEAGAMKWTDTGADFVSRHRGAEAALRQITDPAPPARKSAQEPQDAQNDRDGRAGR